MHRHSLGDHIKHKAMHFMARHRGQHGHRFGHGGFGDSGSFDGPFMGRKLSSQDLELVILALLNEQPLHGYRIIKELEERSKGFYVPSPGMIYPALAFLEEADRIAGEAEGSKKLYRLTDEGRAHLESNRNEANALFAKLAFLGERKEQMREFFADDDSVDLRDTVHELRALVRSKRHADPAERKRVGEILKRTIAAIKDEDKTDEI